jgi:hypothetical protein
MLEFASALRILPIRAESNAILTRMGARPRPSLGAGSWNPSIDCGEGGRGKAPWRVSEQHPDLAIPRRLPDVAGLETIRATADQQPRSSTA